MSIFNGLLRALGFGGSNEDDEELDLVEGAALLTESVEGHGDLPQATEGGNDGENQLGDAAETPSIDNAGDSNTDKPQADKCVIDTKLIFDGVVEVMNSNLPPYLRECLDKEEQCRFIYDHLDDNIRGFIEGVARDEAEKANRRWASEKKKLYKQVNEAAEQIAHATERASKAEEKALSADRQKRAMTQRTTDLEKRVARLQAEIEQYDLEKNSLLNKLRVAEVHNGQGVIHAPADVQAKKDDESDNLAKELEASKTEIETLRAKLEEANKSLEVVNEIQRHMQDVEEMKKRKNARIKELKAENTQLRAALESLKTSMLPVHAPSSQNLDFSESAVGSDSVETKVSVENNDAIIDMTQEAPALPEPDASGVSAVIADDIDLINAISENDAMTDISEPVVVKKKRKPRARKPKLVAIDQSISESEWLLSSSPVPPMDASVSGFGYQEPARRNTPPDNPSQMSLW